MESIQIHHALEAVVGKFGQQPRTARRPPFAVGGKSRARPCSTTAEFSSRSRAARFVPKAALEKTSLQLRIPASQLVRAAHPEAAVRTEHLALSFRPS